MDQVNCKDIYIKSTFGALNGYSAGNCKSMVNIPPEYGVSSGPAIIAFQCNKLSPTLPTVNQSGAFFSNSANSYLILLMYTNYLEFLPLLNDVPSLLRIQK